MPCRIKLNQMETDELTDVPTKSGNPHEGRPLLGPTKTFKLRINIWMKGNTE